MQTGRYHGDIRQLAVGQDRSEMIGIRHGRGVYTYDGTPFRYEGDWRNSRKHGRGKFQVGCPSAGPTATYEGDFVDGEMTGRGTKTWSDGRRYDGEFVMGEFHGKGTFVDKDESRYEGDWESNQRSGNGVLRLANGDVVSGVYRQHCIVQGVWNGASGNRYEGAWQGGVWHGHGVETLSDGAVYTGDFENGRRHGHGTLVEPSGFTYNGAFQGGAPLYAGERVLMFDVRPSGNVAELLTPAEAPTPAKKPAGGKPKQDDAMLNGEPAPLQIAFDDPHVPAFYFCVVDAGQRIVAEESKRALIVDVGPYVDPNAEPAQEPQKCIEFEEGPGGPPSRSATVMSVDGIWDVSTLRFATTTLTPGVFRITARATIPGIPVTTRMTRLVQVQDPSL
ncbi:unnamed protein product (mitochondrion) [Plasmodiophora brassicae]|uniref:MORN repeat-containing protein 5 n=1 Tax=Plasmodiophora brassicae TaxID=37360 RepID=A0A3P3YFF1_PLABS|nr:unnamed protein product [Plasmodiophora brassicae]